MKKKKSCIFCERRLQSYEYLTPMVDLLPILNSQVTPVFLGVKSFLKNPVRNGRTLDVFTVDGSTSK